MHIPSIIAQTQPVETYQTLLNMQPSALFRSLLGNPDTTALVGLRRLMQLFGAVFLLLGHAERTGEAQGNERLGALIKSVVLSFLLFTGGSFLGTIATAMNQAPADVGLKNDTPRMLTALFRRGAQLPAWSDMWKPAVNIPGQSNNTIGGAIQSGVTGANAPTQPQQPPSNWFARQWRWVTSNLANVPLIGMFNSLAGFITRVWIALERLWITSLFLLMMLFVVMMGMMIIWFMEALRYFVLLIGACLLPLFIGFISSRRMQEPGWKYVTAMISVTLWPIGWTMCNAITLELFDMAVRVASGDAGLAASQTFVNALVDPGQSVSWSQFTDVIMTASPMAYGMGVAILIFTMIWVILSAFVAPYLVTKTLISGEEFVFQSMTSTAKVTAKVAGEAAKLAAQAAILAG